MFIGKYFTNQPTHFPFLRFFFYLPHFYTPCAHESYIWHQLENIKHASMKMKTREEFWNLHWDVPEHQDAAPEAILIH